MQLINKPIRNRKNLLTKEKLWVFFKDYLPAKNAWYFL